MSETNSSGYNSLRERKIAGWLYELHSRGKCSCCNVDILEIWRWAGASFARYRLPQHFDQDTFDAYVEDLDEQFLLSSADILADFYEELEKVNSPEVIEANFSYEFKLIEYGRQRASKLQKLGYSEILTSNDPVNRDDRVAIRLAFELGFAAAKHRLMTAYEDYLHDGVAMSEWRNTGLPRARQEGLRQGARTRQEVLSAATRLYENDASLVRNDSETARRILAMRLPALQKPGEFYCLGCRAPKRPAFGHGRLSSTHGLARVRQIVFDRVAFLRGEKGFRRRRPAVPESQGRPRRRSRVPRGFAQSRALGERQPGSRDLPRSLCAGGIALFQSAPVSEHPCSGRL